MVGHGGRRTFLKRGLGIAATTLLPRDSFAATGFSQHWQLVLDGTSTRLNARAADRLGAQVHYRLKHADQTLEPLEVLLLAPHVVRVHFEGAELLETWRGDRDWASAHRCFTVHEPGRWRLSFSLTPDLRTPQMSVPAVSYFDNAQGVGDFPRGGRERHWAFREDRTPLPSCATIHTETYAQSLFCSPARTEAELSSVQIDPERLSIWLPLHEGPTRYVTKGIVLSGTAGPTEFWFVVPPGETPWRMSRDFVFVSAPAAHFTDAFESATRAFTAAGLARPDPRPEAPLPSWAEIRTLKYRHLDDLYLEDGEVAGLRMGLGNGLMQGYYERTAGSFLVLSLDAARLWLNEGLRTGDAALIERARRVGRFFLKGQLPNGLHQDSYDLSSGQWSAFTWPAISREWNAGANARCNAETMGAWLALARGLASLDQHDRDAAIFRATAEACTKFYVANQLENGGFGRYWSQHGQVINAVGTNGAHVLSLLLACERELGPEASRQDAIWKAARYYRGMVQRGEFAGDALDSDCVDREAGVALLTALLDVHEASGSHDMLAGALESARFLLSWTWQYAVPFAPGTELGRKGFTTRGMTSVSVAHPHLDFYGLGIAVQFHRLAKVTDDPFWATQASQMITACRQLITLADGELPGLQPEQIIHTDWSFLAGLSKTRGSSSTCIAWVAVWTLKALERLRAEFPEALGA